jgi:transcription elongation factor GreA
MTAGHATMKAQLKKLKDVDRITNSRAIEVARGHGDLSENADFSGEKNGA